MIFKEIPYFMTNEEWYYHDDQEMVLKLTDKAPQEAIDSYIKFYEQLEMVEKP